MKEFDSNLLCRTLIANRLFFPLQQMNIELPAHEPPVARSTFVSSYDAAFFRDYHGAAQPASSPLQTRPSGHAVNTPSFAANNGTMKHTSTTHLTHDGMELKNRQRDVATIVKQAATEHTLPTAHVRNQPMGGRGTPEPMVSTMKEAFQGRPATAQGPTHVYPGASQVAINHNFFHIPFVPDKTKAPSPHSPPCVWNCKRDGSLHISQKPSNPYTMKALHPQVEQKLKVADPVAFHVYRNQKFYLTQASVIGDSSVAHAQLQPVKLSEATLSGSINSPNKRSLLESLSGSNRTSTASSRMGGLVSSVGSPAVSWKTNPIYLPPELAAVSHVSRRLENEGNVRVTMYQQEFTNRWNLPEQPDPKKTKQSEASNTVVLNKHPLDWSKAKALDSALAPDGGLVAERPEGVNPRVWLRMKKMEASTTPKGPDPHAHKYRSPKT